MRFPEIDSKRLLDVLAQHRVSSSDIAELRTIIAGQRSRPHRF